MAIRYDPALVTGLAREIRSRWVGRRTAELILDGERREAWLRFADAPEGDAAAIVCLLHPSRGFVLEAAPPLPVSRETGSRIPFRRLYLTDVGSPADERLLVFELSGGLRDVRPDLPPVFRLFVELHTNQWNAVLARGSDDRIEAVLWPRSAGGRSLRTGARYVRPVGARRWAEAAPDEDAWSSALDGVPAARRCQALLEGVSWTSSLNVDWILGGAGGQDAHRDLAGAFGRYTELRTAIAEPRGAWLLPAGGAYQPYPLPIGPDARPFPTLADAMGEAAVESGSWPPEDGSDAVDGRGATGTEDSGEAESMRRLLEQRIRRLDRRKAALQRQLEGDEAERLRELGHLLLSRQREVPRGARTASLEGFGGEEIEVTLDPRLDAVGNAELYYDRARRRERAARRIPGRLRATTETIARLEAGLERLRAAGPSDELWDLVGGRPGDAGGDPGSSFSGDRPLPYRRFRSTGGLEIRVGRSSKANDELTFRHSSPEDIWLHARQAAGAHVILRWDRRDQNPPLADLTEAAVLAALHSEARHSGVVAVDWTRRKYVRKPRKSAPGSVLPERVSTLFVEPDREAVSRLDPDA
ncbi:MAG: NFACT RNA binding domain-containing protein [Candidatus Palauibacterales bacterium]|nr:NFACT RNA binding domain-containing protein [Candidatus Palauibacterales bacterium]